VLIKDLMDAVVEVSRAQALKEEYSFAGPADWVKRTRALADKLSPAQAARMWRLLLQGFEDCGRAPDPPAAAQMVVLRLAAAASLPPPEYAMKLLAGGAAVPVPTSQSERGAAERGRAEPARAESPAAVAAPHEEEPHHGVHMASLREIIGELERQRQIDLKYDIEKYVRPAEVDFGHFRYTAAPGAPKDLSARIRDWLEETSGVEWEVLQSNDGAAESPAETRARRHKEKLKAAEGLPRVAEALKVFKGARVLKIEEPEAEEDLDEAPARDNVIHVDFAPREHADPEAIPYEEREDDD
jgi:DNA polymerase-3 subunit gamma/tau